MFLNQQAFLFLSSTVQLYRRTNRIKALPSSAWRGLLSPTSDKVQGWKPLPCLRAGKEAGSQSSSGKAGFLAPSTLLSTSAPSPVQTDSPAVSECHACRPREGEEVITCEHESDVVPLSFLLSGHCINAQQSGSHIFF